MAKKKTTPIDEKKLDLLSLADDVKSLRADGAPLTAEKGYDLRRIAQWSPQRKAAVTRMMNARSDWLIEMPMTGVMKVYPRSKRTKKAIENAFYPNNPKPKWFRGEVIPYRGSKKVRLKVNRKGGLIIQDPQNRIISRPINKRQLVTNTEDYLLDLFDDMRDEGAKAFILKAGQHHFKKGVHNGGTFADPLAGLNLFNKLLNRYENAPDWLEVIDGYILGDEYDDTASAQGFVLDVMREYNKDREILRKERKAAFRRMKREMERRKPRRK